MINWLKKWVGRKALYPIIYAAIAVFNNKLGIGLTDAQLADFANLAIAFVLGEAAIDGIRVYIENKR